MPVFPTLSNPEDNAGEFNYLDTTIRSPAEAGYIQTRPRFTRVRRRWRAVFRNMLPADVAAVDAFVASVNGGADAFDYNGNNVRFAEGGLPRYRQEGVRDLMSIEFEIEQV